MHQDRSYVISLSGAEQLDGMYYGIEPGSLSFRNYKDQLLVGGAGHRTGNNYEGGRYESLKGAGTILLERQHRDSPLVCTGLHDAR